MVRGGLVWAAAHELTHYMEQQSPEMYEAYRAMAFEAMRQEGLDAEAEVQHQMELARRNGQKLTRAQAEAEVIADASSRMLENSRFLKQQAMKDPGLFGRIKEGIENFINKVRGILDSLKGEKNNVGLGYADRLSRLGEGYVNGLQEQWDAILGSIAGELADRGVQPKVTITTSERVPGAEADDYGVKHSYKDVIGKYTIYQQLDMIAEGTFRNEWTIVFNDRTPEAYRKHGFNGNEPLIMSKSKLMQTMKQEGREIGNNGHSMTIDEYKALANGLNTPEFIVDEGRGILLVFTGQSKEDGRPIVASIVKGKGFDGEPGNTITSVYGVDNYRTTLTAKENKGAEITNKKGEACSAKSAIIALAAAGALTKESISGKNGEVKQYSVRGDQTQTESFKRWFGDSKVVDEDGNPLVVYHGTDQRFTVFDMDRNRSNMDIQGAFFSPYYEDAEAYGGNVGEFYLRIQNPASEAMAFKALNLFKGREGAGRKARKWIEAKGYDGVYNGYDEYIAFYPNQIKSATENTGKFDMENMDVSFSRRDMSATRNIGVEATEAYLDAVTTNSDYRNKAVKKTYTEYKRLRDDYVQKRAKAIALRQELESIADQRAQAPAAEAAQMANAYTQASAKVREAERQEKNAKAIYDAMVTGKEFRAVLNVANERMRAGGVDTARAEQARKRIEDAIRRGENAQDAIDSAMKQVQGELDALAKVSKRASRGLFVNNDLMDSMAEALTSSGATRWSKQTMREKMGDLVSSYWANRYGREYRPFPATSLPKLTV